MNLKLFFLPILLIFVFFQWNALFSSFSQDDFFHLRVVMDKNLTDIPSFFLALREEYAFYRPLSRETFNLLMYKTFGLNPLPFHIINYLLIISNMIVLYWLVKILSKNIYLSILATLIYSLSAIHSVELYYLASVQTLFAALFLLLGTLSYVKFLKDKCLRNYLFAFFFFVFGLFSHETAIVLPGILVFLQIVVGRERILDKKFILRLLPFAIIALFYLLNTSLLANLPQEDVYRPVFSIKSILNTLAWYTLWSFGLSEILIDFIGSGFSINPNLIKWYGTYLRIVAPTFVFLTLSLGFFLLKFKKIIFTNRLIFLFATFYIIALSPFLFFPQHRSTYYLSFSTLWFSVILALILHIVWQKSKFTRLWVVLWIVLFAVISHQTISLNELTYWAAKRAKAAQFLLVDIKKAFPSPQKGAVFYFKDDPQYPLIAKEWGSSSKQAFYILSGSDALKLLYKDNTLKAYFEDMGGLPDSIDNLKVIPYVAKFPY